jgi:RND family efflux transporter MFP subunit
MSDLKAPLAALRIDREGLQNPLAGRPRWITWVLYLAASALACAPLARSEFVSRLAAPSVETVQPTVTGGVGRTAGAPILTASGYVVARRQAVVSARIEGRLASLEVDEGTRVRAGQVIARLEDSEYRAQAWRARAALDGASASLVEARRQLAVTEHLVEAGAVAANDLHAARSRVSVAEATLEHARAEIAVQDALGGSAIVLAPFSGTVMKTLAEIGEKVTGPIVSLADLDTLEIEADIGEAQLAKLHADQPAEVAIEAFPGTRWPAVLRAITPVADRTKATVLVHVTIQPARGAPALKPDMAAKVTFVESPAAAAAPPPPPAVLVAGSAVARRASGDVVFEVRDGRAAALPISIGETRGEMVQVKSGLTGRELLVASPGNSLNDGDAVRVKK